MVTYEQLKNGYVLQGEDKLVLHGLDYKVVSSMISGYNYLCYIRGTNSRVFDVLGMDAEERRNFVKRFNPVNYADAQGTFPEFNDFKTLTDLVIALYEVPEYKVGDWVTVLPRTGTYGFISYVDKMVEYAGNTYQVEYCNLRSSTPTHDGRDSGDPHSYNLGGDFYWTTQMLRRATDEEIRRVTGKTINSDCPMSLKQALSDVDFLSEAKIKTLGSEIDSLGKFIKPKEFPIRLNSFSTLPGYTPLWDGISSDTEIRLPNNEEDTPHIKL